MYTDMILRELILEDVYMAINGEVIDLFEVSLHCDVLDFTSATIRRQF